MPFAHLTLGPPADLNNIVITIRFIGPVVGWETPKFQRAFDAEEFEGM